MACTNPRWKVACRPARLLVLFSCLLSLLASRNVALIAQILDTETAADVSTACLHEPEEEPIEDEGEMLQARSVQESQREERKQTRALVTLSHDDAHSSLFGYLSFQHPQRSPGRAGGEHAFRNGVGVPLLC